MFSFRASRAIVAGAALLASCADRDSRAHFEAVTGLPLCETATLRAEPRRSDLGRGFFYRVWVTMDAACRESFFEAIREGSSVDCRGRSPCRARMADGREFIVADDGNQIEFIYAD